MKWMRGQDGGGYENKKHSTLFGLFYILDMMYNVRDETLGEI
jgi:hypothetical protein